LIYVLNLNNTSYIGDGKNTLSLPASRLAQNLPIMNFFFDKNNEPAGDLSLVARGPSVSRHFLMVAKPPAAGRL
jgi:hypothetical protein